jgi:hypothetical protein
MEFKAKDDRGKKQHGKTRDLVTSEEKLKLDLTGRNGRLQSAAPVR